MTWMCSVGHPRSRARPARSYCRAALPVCSRTCRGVDCRTEMKARRSRGAGRMLEEAGRGVRGWGGMVEKVGGIAMGRTAEGGWGLNRREVGREACQELDDAGLAFGGQVGPDLGR